MHNGLRKDKDELARQCFHKKHIDRIASPFNQKHDPFLSSRPSCLNLLDFLFNMNFVGVMEHELVSNGLNLGKRIYIYVT